MKKALLFFLVALSALAADADTMGELFVRENNGLLNSLSVETREELCDNYKNHDTGMVVNNFNDTTSRILMMTDNEMLVATSSSARVHFKLLLTPGKKDTLIMAVETFLIPVPDSRITFYNTQWKAQLTSKYFKMPALADFVLPAMPRPLRDELNGSVDINTVELQLAGNILTARLHLDRFMDKAQYARFAPWLRRELRYQVKNNKIQAIKEK